MNTHVDKSQEHKNQSMTNAVSQKQNNSESTFQFVDNRPEVIAQAKLQKMANNSPETKQVAQLQTMANNYAVYQQQPIQKKTTPESSQRENKTGLPDKLKKGIENLSGYSMDDVRVHRNSDKPTQLQAYAYAQGTDIHLGPGQEKHLPHEAWHVVQQKQGRVKPTMQMKGKVHVNDDVGLEKEADVMGARALQVKASNEDRLANIPQSGLSSIFQLAKTVGRHTALADGNIRDLTWNSVATFSMDNDINIVNGDEAEWHGVNHVWGNAAFSANGWINENKVSEGAPDMADVLWTRALKNAVTYDDILTNLGYAFDWATATGEPWFVGGDSVEQNTKNFARWKMLGQVAAPGDFTIDQNVDPELIILLNANPFIQGMLVGEVARVGTPAPAHVIGAIANPSGMLSRAAERFDDIVTTPVPQIGAESVSKLDPVSYMRNDGTSITQGTGATEGILLHEMGHHLENNLDPADFATLHNFMRARAVDDGTGSPRMKGVGYKRLGGKKSSGEGYDTTPINYNVKNMAGINMIPHLANLGLKKGPLGFTDARRSEAKRDIEDSMLSWGNSNNVSYNTQSDSGNYATEFLSTSIEFFAKGTTVRNMIDADPLRVALLLYLARRADYILVRDALQARYHLPVPMPGMNYMLDDLIHKVSL